MCLKNKIINFLGGYTKEEFDIKNQQANQLSDLLLAVTDALHNLNEREKESLSNETCLNIRTLMRDLRLLSSYNKSFIYTKGYFDNKRLSEFTYYLQGKVCVSLSEGKFDDDMYIKTRRLLLNAVEEINDRCNANLRIYS